MREPLICPSFGKFITVNGPGSRLDSIFSPSLRNLFSNFLPHLSLCSENQLASE